jgi:D-cysteine desulfhydrase
VTLPTTAAAATAGDGDALPLLARFPALRAIPRVALCTLPSPVLRASVGGTGLWIKHDGVNAPVAGGNKVRMLEFLLAGVAPGDTVLTVGGEGSTHVLATAAHAARLGARTVALRWRHEMNPTAREIATDIVQGTVSARVHRLSAVAVAHAQWMRLTGHVHYVPLGGSTPHGVLGMVNAGMELAAQIHAGELPRPERVVVALGSGGTMAGLALGLAIAALDVVVIGVQVTPAIIANRSRVQRLVARTARLIERTTGERVRRPASRLLGVARGAYGGAYGRLVPSADAAAERLRDATGIQLDQTYTAKAFAVALELARDRRTRGGGTLFWNTFDSRLLDPPSPEGR